MRPLRGIVGKTYDGSNDEWEKPQPVVRIGLQHVGGNLVYLKATHRADCEDVEPRREQNGEDECRARTSPTEHKSEDGEHDGEERGCDGSELRALAERRGDEERPAGERETEQEVVDDDDADVRRGEDAEVPDNSYDNPCREICKRDADMPRTASMNP